MLQELSDYQGSSEFEDDVTMLVARYLGDGKAASSAANENSP